MFRMDSAFFWVYLRLIQTERIFGLTIEGHAVTSSSGVPHAHQSSRGTPYCRTALGPAAPQRIQGPADCRFRAGAPYDARYGRFDAGAVPPLQAGAGGA